jgi:putative CocE/NonD family hydrolase
MDMVGGSQADALRSTGRENKLMNRIVLLCAVVVVSMSCPGAFAGQSPADKPTLRPGQSDSGPYSFTEAMIPMRDGIRLQTVIIAPNGVNKPLPILLRRTPYGVPTGAFDAIPESLKALAADGYIFVIQNIRGRFKSEGTFTISGDFTVTAGEGTVETRDGWDTVDWLVKNVPNNNGRVGIYGVSYDGYTAAATLLGPHPALKAVSEQASPADEWMNDDDHRFGALRLSYAFEYAVLEEADKTANTHFFFDKWDTYEWYLSAGSLESLNERYIHGKIQSWNEMTNHPDYDDFWKKQAFYKELHRSSVPSLNVAGFWDQEDPWGPWQIFRSGNESDPNHVNLMVAGPWAHGSWRRSVSALGPLQLGQDTALTFRKNIEAPFFAYWLHDQGTKPAWAATMFQTGTNAWKTYASWPPAAAKPTSLFLHADGSLSFAAPTAAEKGSARTFVSDPANPVPYRPRPISPTYPGGDWRNWESVDQRFVDHRPDVLNFVSQPLTENLVVTGPVAAEIFTSTSGTDSDLIVKLIDVIPDNEQAPSWSEEDGPAPGQFAQSENGYELPIAMEVRRGRYLDSFEHPRQLTPGKPRRWDVPLRDRDHVFLKGHRIMVQVQSSWFPLIDLNPQTYVPNIAKAPATAFVASTQKIYSATDMPSRIILSVVPNGQ